jgi:CRISPR-associated endonuclease/helicase Cas3
MTPYYAHSGDPSDFSTWQRLNQHLVAVAALAEEKAKTASPSNESFAAAARTAGLLHDLGKYRSEFQLYIRGITVPKEMTYHKQAGAAKAAYSRNSPVAFAIAGHHGGMPNKADLLSLVRGASGQPVAEAVWHSAVEDCPELGTAAPTPLPLLDNLHGDLFTRLLFSCLVDADWTDTAFFYGQRDDPPLPFDAPAWLKRLLTFVEAKAATCKDPQVAQVRKDIFRACLEKAVHPPGLFTLTVPTGGGKTLSGLAFALKHAATHGLRRVIYVAPYLSILDQNVRVIREAMTGSAEPSPLVFEHHSLAEPPGDEEQNQTSREAAARRAENWDSPVIVTTNVQFYESLFSNKPSRCRKVHNIARSVILLDECQTLPPELVGPTCGMLRQVASHLGCTIVLCTATQPAFDHASLGEDRLRAVEIIPPDLDLFNRLRRVELVWPTHKAEERTWPEVAAEMLSSGHPNTVRSAALCVVNTRRAARELFAELKRAGRDGVFHLSTSMCPAHRLQVLAHIKERLDGGRSCFLAATQLIEAGVDVDFPFVMREMAPLEAIIQAAGRCNREGLMNGPGGSPGGKVVIFRSPERSLPPDRWYRAGRQVVENNFLAAGREPRIDEPEDIADYYIQLYYSGSLDPAKIRNDRDHSDFALTAEKYHLIEDDGVPVVVASWEQKRAEIEGLLAAVKARPSRANFRKLNPYQVNLRRYELNKVGGSVEQLDARLDLLVWRGPYDADLGLRAADADVLLLV